ncbi:MAG: DUF547 domain-containing protein [Erythrobacter sp.]|nr:DUF547 domain-containing protein [Erythrobacter sp.]
MLVTTALAAPAAASSLPAAAPHGGDAPRLLYVPPIGDGVLHQNSIDDHLAVFTPTVDPIRHTIDYEIWDYALKNIVITMGPPDRRFVRRPDPVMGTRIKQGAQSPYRLEGSMVLFRFLNKDITDSFTAYRKDLESVTETLDISALPRNEQLAFWLNLHNVAMLEQIAQAWPVREPREIMLDRVPLDEARFITVRGVPVSLRDIRENIVFRHWKDPKVIYGFWRGEIGGPELQRHAFTGANVGSLLEVAALDFVNSLRGTQQRGDRLEVASLYAEVAPFYFRDFEPDLRAHLTKFAEQPVAELLTKTSTTSAGISETDIADLHGGTRPPNYLFVGSSPGAMDDPLVGWSESMGQAAFELLNDRARKLQTMQRRGQPTGRVFFSNIDLPGDPPNKNAVE